MHGAYPRYVGDIVREKVPYSQAAMQLGCLSTPSMSCRQLLGVGDLCVTLFFRCLRCSAKQCPGNTSHHCCTAAASQRACKSMRCSTAPGVLHGMLTFGLSEGSYMNQQSSGLWCWSLSRPSRRHQRFYAGLTSLQALADSKQFCKL